MSTATTNIHIVNNTGEQLPDAWRADFLAHINDGRALPGDISGLFRVKVLQNYNPDGSNRGIIDWV